MELREVFEPIINFVKNFQKKDKDKEVSNISKQAAKDLEAAKVRVLLRNPSEDMTFSLLPMFSITAQPTRCMEKSTP